MEPPRGERLRGPQARLAVLASAARSNRQGAQGKGGLEGEGVPSVAQRPSWTGEPGTGIPVFALAEMPRHSSTLTGKTAASYRKQSPRFVEQGPILWL